MMGRSRVMPDAEEAEEVLPHQPTHAPDGGLGDHAAGDEGVPDAGADEEAEQQWCERAPGGLSMLHADVWAHVAKWLPVTDLLSCARVNKHTAEVMRDRLVWRQAVTQLLLRGNDERAAEVYRQGGWRSWKGLCRLLWSCGELAGVWRLCAAQEDPLYERCRGGVVRISPPVSGRITITRYRWPQPPRQEPGADGGEPEGPAVLSVHHIHYDTTTGMLVPPPQAQPAHPEQQRPEIPPQLQQEPPFPQQPAAPAPASAPAPSTVSAPSPLAQRRGPHGFIHSVAQNLRSALFPSSRPPPSPPSVSILVLRPPPMPPLSHGHHPDTGLPGTYPPPRASWTTYSPQLERYMVKVDGVNGTSLLATRSHALDHAPDREVWQQHWESMLTNTVDAVLASDRFQHNYDHLSHWLTVDVTASTPSTTDATDTLDDTADATAATASFRWTLQLVLPDRSPVPESSRHQRHYGSTLCRGLPEYLRPFGSGLWRARYGSHGEELVYIFCAPLQRSHSNSEVDQMGNGFLDPATLSQPSATLSQPSDTVSQPPPHQPPPSLVSHGPEAPSHLPGRRDKVVLVAFKVIGDPNIPSGRYSLVSVFERDPPEGSVSRRQGEQWVSVEHECSRIQLNYHQYSWGRSYWEPVLLELGPDSLRKTWHHFPTEFLPISL